MLWIKLHIQNLRHNDIYENDEIRVSYGTICCMRPLRDGGTAITITGADTSFEVKESMDEIEELAKNTYMGMIDSIV